MNEYNLGITREALKKGDPTIDVFVEKVKGVEGIVVPDTFGKRVQVKYMGSIQELYDVLGYSPEQVHIEPPIISDHPD